MPLYFFHIADDDDEGTDIPTLSLLARLRATRSAQWSATVLS
jgi:hypothetical protein